MGIQIECKIYKHAAVFLKIQSLNFVSVIKRTNALPRRHSFHHNNHRESAHLDINIIKMMEHEKDARFNMYALIAFKNRRCFSVAHRNRHV